MENQAQQQEQSQQPKTGAQQAQNLAAKLWDMANELRGKMDASEYRDYILGFIFYRYLSEKQEQFLKEQNLIIQEDGQSINDAYRQQVSPADLPDVRENLITGIGYAIDPEDTWATLVKKAQTQTICPEDFQNMFDHFRANANLTADSKKNFMGVFDNINLSNSSLGNSTTARAKSLSKLLEDIDGIEFKDSTGRDVLGSVYEYLIAQFAGNSGKKAGEFYTPHEVSDVLARLVTYADPSVPTQDNKAITDTNQEFEVYDPMCGSGSLLLTVQQEVKGGLDNPERVKFYGQELNSTTYNLARMNLMMHDVPFTQINLRNADTLESDWPDGTDANGVDHPLFFDAVVANPPYSQKWDNAETKLKDPRFKDYGKLAPKSKADYAFVEHCVYHLKPTGRMAIVLPHGVLFRGAAEGIIRKALIEKNYLDAVIGLPANFFYSTGIPTVVLVFRKNRTNSDILFIDASKHFEKSKNQNRLRKEDIDLIIKTYEDRKDVDKLAHVASLDEIKDNDYNLNIPRYVDTFEEEPPIDIDEVNRQLAEVDQQMKDLTAQFDQLASQLVKTDAWKDPKDQNKSNSSN